MDTFALTPLNFLDTLFGVQCQKGGTSVQKILDANLSKTGNGPEVSNLCGMKREDNFDRSDSMSGYRNFDIRL